MQWLEGKKTYGGLSMAAIGILMAWFGFTETQATALVSDTLQGVGVLVATYGRFVAKLA